MGSIVLIGVRLIPIMPFSLMGYVCGAARVPLVRFTWTTAVGYAPITAYFTYLGSRLEGFSAEDPILWIGGVGLLLCMLGVRYLMPQARTGKRSRDQSPSPPRAGEELGRQGRARASLRATSRRRASCSAISRSAGAFS